MVDWERLCSGLSLSFETSRSFSLFQGELLKYINFVSWAILCCFFILVLLSLFCRRLAAAPRIVLLPIQHPHQRLINHPSQYFLLFKHATHRLFIFPTLYCVADDYEPPLAVSMYLAPTNTSSKVALDVHRQSRRISKLIFNQEHYDVITSLVSVVYRVGNALFFWL